MNCINRFQNSQALSVSVVNNYSQYHLMRIFMDKFHQGVKYTVQIAIHQAELVREEKLLTKDIYLTHIYRMTI